MSPAAAFGVTIVDDSRNRNRNRLLLATAFFLTTTLGLSVVVSIFNKALDLESPENSQLLSFVSPVDPLPQLEPEDPETGETMNADGGGGGRNESLPAQKGAAATQTDNPLFAPSKTYDKLTDPTIRIRAATKGNRDIPPSDMPYGLTRGDDTGSDGTGCCGGQGDTPNGRGGQGNEPGAGLNSGRDRRNARPGEDEDDEAPQVKAKVTSPLRVISKPRANYTDQAREKLLQGKVILRVTFMANGKIGNIAVVQGLPAGLTEQAIAAARQITFEPAKSNGTPVSTTKVIEYGFAIF